MNQVKKSWAWFVVLMVLIVTAGIFLGRSQRTELGESFDYSLEDYRNVDPALIRYIEIEPLVPALGKISALAVGSDGKVYVGGINAIEIFPGGEKVEIPGTPSCLAVDEDGILFVGFQDHLTIFSNDRKPKLSLSLGKTSYITSIAVDDEFIYVADAGRRRVWRYSKAGADILEIGAKDVANGVRGFHIPSPSFDLDIGTDGSIWVVNPGYHAFENYSPDGRLISSWERTSFSINGFSGCCNPAHFALMSDGSFLTAEKGLVRVKIHNLDGSLRCVVAAPHQFDAPILDVAADAAGRIHILDGDRVRVFEEKKP